jgi:ketosteroid isomerase-like protein
MFARAGDGPARVPNLENTMLRRTVILLALAATVGACTQQAAAPAADLAAEELAIRDASAKWLAAVQAKDWAAAAASFAADGMAFPQNQAPLVGPAAVQANAEAQAAAMPNMTTNWTTDLVVVAASGDLAYESGTWTMTNEGTQDTGKYITVWRKLDGQWKAVADMGVSTMPADTTK